MTRPRRKDEGPLEEQRKSIGGASEDWKLSSGDGRSRVLKVLSGPDISVYVTKSVSGRRDDGLRRPPFTPRGLALGSMARTQCGGRVGGTQVRMDARVD